MRHSKKVFVISRTDSIGDVVLTLPMAGLLKQLHPDCFIYFLGQKYTQPVIECCNNIDAFLDWSEVKKKPIKEQVMIFQELSADEIIHIFPKKDIAKLAKRAKIPVRTGTRNRWYHFLHCNKLIKLSRRKSNLHEAQLNSMLLSDFPGREIPKLEELRSFYGIKALEALPNELQQYLASDKINLILHPKSKGSAREWGLDNYAELIKILPQDRYNILLTGTEEEGLLFRETLVFPYPFVYDLSGKISLKELISLIYAADALVACSTGPLHIAAMLGKLAIGIYPPIQPMHPGRWAPIGENAHVLVSHKACEKCRKSADCECIRSITPAQVVEVLEKQTASKQSPEAV